MLIHDKTSVSELGIQEISQFDEGHAQRILQLLSYLLVRLGAVRGERQGCLASVLCATLLKTLAGVM